MEYLNRLRQNYETERSNQRQQSCIDFMEVFRHNMEHGFPKSGSSVIGKNVVHQYANQLMNRQYWTGCSELRDFLSANHYETMINNEYVSKFSENPISYY
jgi:hypothetical protein